MARGKQPPGPPPAEGESLADDLRRLEEIVRRLETDDTDLDAALVLFEEGVTRLRAARARLDGVEKKVRKVTEAADGAIELTDLDD